MDGNIVPCISLTVNQSLIPLSNATMEVLKDDVLPIRTYVEISTPNGITEIYRTRQPQVTHGSDIATIQLDHAISEIGDYLIQDAIEEEKTVAQAFSTVFSHYRGTDWQLGTITASDTVTLDVDYDNVLESLLGILEQVPQYYMTFDFTTSPWTLGIAEKTYTVTAEGRLSRNIESAVVKYDDKDQCTRVYVKGLPKPSGQEDDEDAIGYMDADANTIALYGIIEKETGSGNLTEAQATRVATAYLNAHKLPKKSVEINGDDLSEITGESLDSFVTGKLFRLAIPQNGQVVEDYITKVSFQDIISSSYANVIIGDELDAAINFLQEQASSTKSSRSAAKKQQKLDDAFEKNFVKTDEYGAILEQAGMKLDSHGMIVYARDNVNNIGSILDMTASEIRAEVAAGDLGLRSEISQTASAIRLSVDNSLSDIGSNIVQTADQIYSDVHAANSTIYSYISQTATSITSRVENINDDLHSEIIQTQSMIRSAVWTANSQVYSYVDQTASYILDHVGERTGAKVFTGTDEPTDSPDNPIAPGDLWLDGNYINFWDDADFQYVSYDPDDPEYDWTQLRGSQLKVWKDGEWKIVEDYTTLAEDTDIRRTKDQINLVAHNLVSVDGEMKSNLARLDVKADRITSTVNERIADVGSRITQTAYEIRAEVHSANSQLYSAIEQTATQIRSYVVDEINDLGSEISQTASQIRLEVHASQSQLYSAIEQTATSIRSYVKNEIDDVGSEILQTASMIRSEVHAANSQIYSSITQTASAIRQEVANTESSLRGSITVESNRISLVVEGTGSNAKIKPASIVQSINNGASSIIISANHINLDGYVKATDLTADLFKSKISLIDTMSVGYVSVGAGKSITLNGGSGTSTEISYASIINVVKDLQITSSGNTYTLQKKNYNGGTNDWVDVGSFSRAVSSWNWTGGNGQVKVTAQPQNQTLGVDVRVTGDSTISSNGTYTYKVQYEDNNGSYWDTGASKSVTVNVPPTAEIAYNGQSEPSGISGLGDFGTVSPVHSYDWYIVTAKAGSSTKPYKMKVGIADSNFKASNIKAGVTILDVTGTYSPPTPSPEATLSYNAQQEPSGISGLGDFGTVSPVHSYDWYIVTAKAGSSTKPYKMKVSIDDSNFKASNIKAGVTILDVTGTYSPPTPSPEATLSYNAQQEPSGISGLGDLGVIETPDLWDWFIVTAKAGSNSKPYKLKVDATAKWTEGYNYDDSSTHHNLHIYGSSYATIYSTSAVNTIPRGETWTVYPGFKMWGKAGTSDDDIVWGSAVQFKAQSGTPVNMTCTGKTQVAPGSNIYNYTFTAQASSFINVGSSRDFYYF